MQRVGIPRISTCVCECIWCAAVFRRSLYEPPYRTLYAAWLTHNNARGKAQVHRFRGQTGKNMNRNAISLLHVPSFRYQRLLRLIWDRRQVGSLP